MSPDCLSSVLTVFIHLCPSRYLQEVGYTDTILDVRSQRVRSLLGLSGSEQNGSVETKNIEQILNGGESPAKRKGQDLKRYRFPWIFLGRYNW